MTEEQKAKQEVAEAQPTEAPKEAPKEATKEATEQTAKNESPKEEVKLSEKQEEIIKTVESMTVLELADLVKALEDKFGVSAAVSMGGFAGAGAGAGAPGAAQEEEKTSFTVVLTGFGEKKINVIKEIRAVTTLGLKEAKDLVEAAPKTVKEGVTKDEAEKIKKQLEAVGAKVELK